MSFLASHFSFATTLPIPPFSFRLKPPPLAPPPRRRWPPSLPLSLRRKQTTAAAAMALQQQGPLSVLSPWLVASALVVLSFSVWIVSFVYPWLHELDMSSSYSGAPTFIEDPTSLEKMQCPSLFDSAEKYISLIMPAFNEEARLSGALDETLRYLQKRANMEKQFTYEIIIVDDGSKDKTLKVAFDYVKRFKLDLVRVIKQGKNYGKGAAVRKGMLCARGKLLLMLDSDGATKISDLEKLENEIITQRTLRTSIQASDPLLITGQPLAAFGSRAHLEKQALATRKWYRNILMKGFHICVLLVAGPGIRDTQCGFKMFTRAAAQKLFTNVRLKRWCFDVELVHLCKRLSIPIVEVAVNWTEIPGSKVKMLSIFHMLLELILIRLGYGLGIWRIRTNSSGG
ncbi:hypothetical protein O6H91_22G010700 [Diphasiastrum complanatum]|uniref:Uncharacterized protein n=1 Tax=Diphasiastrum complanatum TaxID=34168 RepID=A0ACC2ACR4_DIPCM|nr:hypothetical protein O6H91_22G010700 [Diphasiastrum complanatum]